MSFSFLRSGGMLAANFSIIAGEFYVNGADKSRECYCANHLSAISAKLADSECNLACEGNSTQFCGGNLKLSVYQAKSATKGAGIKDVHAPLESILALGIAMGVLLCLA